MSVWDEIARLDAPSGGVFALTGLSLAGYIKLQLVMAGIVTGTDATDPYVTGYVGGVEQVGASAYRWAVAGVSDSSLTSDTGDAGDPLIRLNNSATAGWDVGNAAGEGFDGILEIDEPNSVAHHKRFHFEVVFENANGTLISYIGGGILQVASALDGVKLAGSAAYTSGSVVLLGTA